IHLNCRLFQPQYRTWERLPSFAKFRTTRFFHHIFPVPPSQTYATIGARIHRRCSIEKCARLQRWTYFRLRFFTALCQHMAPVSTPATARQSSKSAAKSNVLNILHLTALLSSTSLIL